MTEAERLTLESIYVLWLSADGRRERETRRAIEALIGGPRCAVLRREWLVARAKKKDEKK